VRGITGQARREVQLCTWVRYLPGSVRCDQRALARYVDRDSTEQPVSSVAIKTAGEGDIRRKD